MSGGEASTGSDGAWELCADAGGTFTDCVAVDPAGAVRRAKVLSTAVLRVRIERSRCEREVVVAEWPPGFDEAACRALTGMRARYAGDEPAEAGVCAADFEARRMRLDAALAGPAAGRMLELWADEEAPILALRLLSGTPVGTPLPRARVRLATTRATNALLTGSIAPAALFVTRGFADLLIIGNQQRPDLFALGICKAPPLHCAVVEVDERVGARGEVLAPLNEPALESAARAVAATGVRCAAVAFLHSDRFPAHERAAVRILRAAGFEHITVSSEAAPFIKIVPRAQTAVVDACLRPVLAGYLGRIERAAGGDVQVMSSAGGLGRAGRFAAKDSLLSGPAAGVIGALAASVASGFQRVIAFDMGGTSTDVSRLNGTVRYTSEHTVAGTTLIAPAVAIETVAAGGGSICRVRAGSLCVGPESAGADPGPACYRPVSAAELAPALTLTDVNLLLGRLDPARVAIPVFPGNARRAFDSLIAELGGVAEPDRVLSGLLDLAAETMAGAVRRVSTRDGFDPTGHALLAFGGAGPQHGCALADRLGVDTVLVPRDAGLLSAGGLWAARLERVVRRQVLGPLTSLSAGLLRAVAAEAVDAARAEADGSACEVRVARTLVDARVAGQESPLEFELAAGVFRSAMEITGEETGESLRAAVEEAFRAAYRAVFSCEAPARPIEVVALTAVAVAGHPKAELPATGVRGDDAEATGTTSVYFDGRWRTTARLERSGLSAGRIVAGPALITEAHSTTVIEPGWSATVDPAGCLVIRRVGGRARSLGDDAPARTELFAARLTGIARQMGESLRRAAVSTNVKERLDFSCAILDSRGELIVNAPHVPVHLGSLGLCVRSVLGVLPLRPGDVAVTNHPAFGGSHLPDITVIAPVFAAGAGEGGTPLAYVAARAHHAEIGGTHPGSTPPGARRLAEEGVVIAPMHLVRAGESCFEAVAALLRAPPRPSRCPEDNLADLQAAVAAVSTGGAAIRELAGELGPGTTGELMEAVARRADGAARAALARQGTEERLSEELLDDGSALRARLRFSPGEPVVLTVDMTGSAPTHPGNLNATPAIVRSVVLYALRLLVREDLPLNEGLLRSVRIVLPEGSIVNPKFDADPDRCPAVVGGNTETSQRLVDTILKALGVAACSQGTMNNLLFGDAGSSYYETICGGEGATPGRDGGTAVHTHMTNTRITDPEILETRFPVRLEEFAVRRGSGGAGAKRGGDGVVRSLRFLRAQTVSIVSQHRAVAPYGVGGGAPGAPGEQLLERADGSVERLPSSAAFEAKPGDRLTIRTPGGGGFGRPI